MGETNDIYEAKLDEAKKVLEQCQESKGFESCLKCPEIIGCEVRTQYVRSVYESMSKGSTGGFDF
ncbi:MAG: hypothetical protein PHW18_07990 [Sulfuricurvum sp.]|uniref:hypothetical protein n=1 Tax=Sulfuricurvum sp. TaxID=2025608 RepID=UPI0026031ACE|nr:hypothetical protein [Sulfuricurvum sp.]MDD2829496.1 hypothetical protein [Sulfuricurvum sp.]MDD4949507.1 hypothetical protein [Sulfuricurvum sp.]